jgi:hypothetical protein
MALLAPRTASSRSSPSLASGSPTHTYACRLARPRVAFCARAAGAVCVLVQTLRIRHSARTFSMVYWVERLTPKSKVPGSTLCRDTHSGQFLLNAFRKPWERVSICTRRGVFFSLSSSFATRFLLAFAFSLVFVFSRCRASSAPTAWARVTPVMTHVRWRDRASYASPSVGPNHGRAHLPGTGLSRHGSRFHAPRSAL